MKKVFAAIRLLLFLHYQMVIANLQVARDVIRPLKYLRPRIIRVPLEESSDAQIALLVNLVTLTPGTIAVDIAGDKRSIYVHSIDVRDSERLRQQIKNGFERRIREVFE